MFVEKPFLKCLKLNSEQTKQLSFESLMKYVWQLLNLGECLSHFFEISLQSVAQPFQCNPSNLVASVGSAELQKCSNQKVEGLKIVCSTQNLTFSLLMCFWISVYLLSLCF